MANLLERVEELHRRVTELEQRVPKPIPVVEPLAERVIRDAHEACGESPVFVEPLACKHPYVTVNGRCDMCGEHGLMSTSMIRAISHQHEAEKKAQQQLANMPKPSDIDAIERGILPPPKPYAERILEEAVALLEAMGASQLAYGSPEWASRRESFLARARVAKAGP